MPTRPPIIALYNLKTIRMQRDMTTNRIAEITGVTLPRVKELDSTRPCEPWLDEAAAIARAVGCATIAPLITSDNLTTIDTGFSLGDERTAHRAGLRLPLSAAINLCRTYGLSDPIDLLAEPLHLQLWSTLQSNERHPEASGWCPWCAADIFGGSAHTDLCLPNNLWGRDFSLRETITTKLRPARAGARQSRMSSRGHGLRVFRQSRVITQREIADAVGIDRNHYARMERCEVPLTLTTAHQIAAHFEIDLDLLYQREDGSVDAPAPPSPADTGAGA